MIVDEKIILTCRRIEVFRPNVDSNEVELSGSSTIETGLLSRYIKKLKLSLLYSLISLFIYFQKSCYPDISLTIWNKWVSIRIGRKSAKLKILYDKTFDSHLSERCTHFALGIHFLILNCGGETYPVLSVVAFAQLFEAVAAWVGRVGRDRGHALGGHNLFGHCGRVDGRFLLRLFTCARFNWFCVCLCDGVVLFVGVLAFWRRDSEFLQLLLECGAHSLLKECYFQFTQKKRRKKGWKDPRKRDE